jgi:hypothetical protein
MALEDALGKVPGLAGYLGRQQFDREQSLGQLQQFSAASTLAANLKAQQEGAQIKEILAGSPDLTSAIPKLAALGPTGITVATHLTALEKARKTNELMNNAMTGGGLADPDTLDRLAQAHLAAGDHTNAAAIGTLADRRRTQLRDAAALSGMKSAPSVPGIAPDVQETQQAADQGTPLPVPSAAQPARSGAVPDYLLQSPHVGASAKALQARIDAGFVPTAGAAEKLIENLGKSHDTMVQANSMIAQRAANAVHLKITVPGPDATPAQRQSTAAMVATGMPLATAIPGFGAAAVAARNQARNDAIEQIKQETGMTDAQAGEELANRNIQFAAGKRSTTQLTTMLGATRQAVDQLDFNVKKVSDEMAKLPSSDLSPIINAIARGASKWTGDPAYSSLFFYMHAAAMESARILQGGQASIAQLHQGAADEARKWADANFTTPAAWNQGVAPAMHAEGAERIKTYQRAINAAKLGQQNPAAPPSPNLPSAAAPDSGWKVTPIP